MVICHRFNASSGFSYTHMDRTGGWIVVKKLSAVLLCVMSGVSLTAASQATVVLGSAANFAVLAGATVTNTGSSHITGDLGVSPGTAVTGFPPGTVNGTI